MFYYFLLFGIAGPIWSRSFDMGPRWRRNSLTVYPDKNVFSLIWEGVVGTGYAGDIAIDNIKIEDGACAAKGLTYICTGQILPQMC